MKDAVALLAVLALLLSGCADDLDAAAPATTPPPSQALQPEAANATAIPAFVPVEVLNVSVDLQPAATAPPTTFQVPEGATNLTVTVAPVQTMPCRLQYPEADPASGDPTDPFVDSAVVLENPAGHQAAVSYDTTSSCPVGAASLDVAVAVLPASPGEWSAQVRGWGSGVRVHVVAVAT